MNIFKKIIFFYLDGFKSMKVGKKLWAIIAFKFFIIFAILKIFFFPDILQTRFSNNSQRANYIINNLTQITQTK